MPNPIPLEERLAWLDEREAWRKTLPEPSIPDFLTGLKLRAPDLRDYQMPSSQERGIVGLPDNADISGSFPGPVLNQGNTPSCVCHTMSHQQCVFQYQEERLARVFDANRAHNETGPANQGRWPDDILKYARDRGMPLTGSEQRFRIVSYAFAPKHTPEAWTDSIKAAIAAGHPVPICMLLPSIFGSESSGEITSGYHEVLIVGYRPNGFLVLNSWGQGWGRSGFGWVPINFLTQQNFQNGYVIAHSSVVDETTTPPIPPDPPIPPTPVVRVFLAGEARGSGMEMLQADQTLAATGHGFSGTIQLNEVRRETDPNPPDPPDPPIPPDPPDPPMPIGELAIEMVRLTAQSAGWFEFRAKAGGQYVSAYIEVMGQRKMTIARPNGAVAAKFWLGNSTGQTVTATATEINGTRTGQLTFTV